jgi:hypothetical protein
MEIRFLIDDDTGLPHIYNHGVDELEVIEILESSPFTIRGRRGARIALGQTMAGRYLKIVYRIEDGELLVITAFNLTGKALKAFRRRRRHRGQ